jgi:AcrR family transcriptional regulator
MSRDKILDAAIERIARDGIDGVRIARIAMDAGVSTALVHYHFATREALLAEALEYSFELAGDTRTVEAGEGSAVHRLREMIDQCLPYDGALRDDWLLWVELWLHAARRPDLRETAARLYARLHAWFEEAIVDGVRRGELTVADPPRVTDRLLALIDGYGIRALLADPAMPVTRAREEIWAAVAPDLGLEA